LRKKITLEKVHKVEIEDFTRPDKRLIEGFREVSTANISDALDKLRVKGGCKDILPIVDNKKIVGPAFTLKYMPVGPEPGTVGDYLEATKQGDIIVIDNGGRTYCTVWGDLLTFTAQKLGVSGTVIDGVCRDITRIRELDYPIFVRGRFMVTGKGRVQLEGVNIPVTISNVSVSPGDIVVADDSGVVIIPFARAEEILQLAKEISEAEELIEKAVGKGIPLSEARKQFHYHDLQKPNK
jgi:4-hydroxy-4-methyl-2-oxoglutarate aldolase